VAVRVGVFCGSNVGSNPAFVEHAARLGAALAERDLGLVYGGGHVGLMGVVADAALDGGGEVIGVLTDALVRSEILHPGLTSLEVVASMHERKARMADLASGFIALPGGYGTLDETIELLTWNQLGLITKPVVFLDVGEFFAPLFTFFDTAVAAAFIRPSHRELAQRAGTVEQAVDMAIARAPETPHKWIDRDRA
jgi:uncharacterized protein (TIGR00730 family)